jgi:hypothetical protein
MNAKLIVEGKEFEIEILDPELEKLIKPSTRKTGYERVDKGEYYYYGLDDGNSGDMPDDLDEVDKEMYNNANYYSGKTVAENNARADKLMRQLRRFAVEHRNYQLNWSDNCQHKYYIYYDYDSNSLEVEYYIYVSSFGNIYFNTRESALAAISSFNSELIWYFTEYKDSL